VHADPLPDTTLAALSGFFEKGTLDRTRIRHVPSIENPPFYQEFEEAGEAFPLDFTVWAAITFGDVILVNGEQVPGPPSHSVVFHEMVHVVQYDELGIHEFARRYVTPFVQSRFNYMSIPLESVAFDLQGRFEERSRNPFSAEEEIRSRISAPGLPYAGSGRAD
tara:strand:- start:4 stop:495 length:492 start_codon:yes stop_codon:yes gene_type:complete